MNVGELGDGVAAGVVISAARCVAAVQVGYGDRADRCGEGGGQHLGALAECENEIGLAFHQGVGEALYGMPCSSRDGSRIVARAPFPSSRFSRRISPPWARAICWASARPTPLPFGLVV